jgi:hypothetical protein
VWVANEVAKVQEQMLFLSRSDGEDQNQVGPNLEEDLVVVVDGLGANVYNQ